MTAIAPSRAVDTPSSFPAAITQDLSLIGTRLELIGTNIIPHRRRRECLKANRGSGLRPRAEQAGAISAPVCTRGRPGESERARAETRSQAPELNAGFGPISMAWGVGPPPRGALCHGSALLGQPTQRDRQSQCGGSAERQRLPGAESALADYPTHESLVCTSKNTSGFSLVALVRLLFSCGSHNVHTTRAPAARRQGQCQVLHDGLAQRRESVNAK